jgi:hypothetical protein
MLIVQERFSVTTVDSDEVIRWVKAARCPECHYTFKNCTCGPTIKELCKLADAAESRITQLEQKWIPVEEKLPEIVREFGGRDNKMYGESVQLLIWDGRDMHVGYFYKSGTWDSIDGNVIKKPTHWMPRPEPPRAGELSGRTKP